MAGQLKKAVLFEVRWRSEDSPPQPVTDGKRIEVHFNPQSLKLTYSNESRGDNQSRGASRQFIGSGTTKLAVELLFDTTKENKDEDVRKQTDIVADFMRPKSDPNSRLAPPGIAFEWGTFKFAGIVDSLQSTLDYFSETGVPLRATLSLSITGIDTIVEQNNSGENNQPGSLPMTAAGTNDNVPNLAGREGNSSNWKAIAAANNIDNPLRLNPGLLIDLNAGARTNANANANANASASLGGQANIGAAAGISGRAGFSAGLGGGAGFSGSAGINAGAGISANIGGGISGGAGAEAGIGATTGVSAGIRANAGFQTGTGARANVVAGGGFGAGVDVTK